MLEEECLLKTHLAEMLSFQVVVFLHQQDDAVWASPSRANKQLQYTSKIKFIQGSNYNKLSQKASCLTYPRQTKYTYLKISVPPYQYNILENSPKNVRALIG